MAFKFPRTWPYAAGARVPFVDFRKWPSLVCRAPCLRTGQAARPFAQRAVIQQPIPDDHTHCKEYLQHREVDGRACAALIRAWVLAEDRVTSDTTTHGVIGKIPC